MKRNLLFVALVLVGCLGFGCLRLAASPALKLAKANLGGFGGPHFKIGKVKGKTVILGGGPAAVVIAGKWIAGLSVSATESDLDGLSISYAGAYLGRLFRPGRVLQFTLATTLGCGRLEKKDDRAGFFIFEPEAEVAVRLGGSFRIGLGAGYWLALGDGAVDAYRPADLSGFHALLRLSYGTLGWPRPAGEGNVGKVTFSGAYVRKGSSLAGRHVELDGGGTCLIVGRRWLFGIGGCRTTEAAPWGGRDLSMGYAGLWAERVVHPDATWGTSLACLVGMGGFSLEDASSREAESQGAFVFEPEVFFHVNLCEFVRISWGFSYRWMIPLGSAIGPSANDLSAFAGGIRIRFGRFD